MKNKPFRVRAISKLQTIDNPQKAKAIMRVSAKKSVLVTNVELRNMTQKELLALTRVLINVRDGREGSFSIQTTPEVINCARRIERMPKITQQKMIAKINKLVFDKV